MTQTQVDKLVEACKQLRYLPALDRRKRGEDRQGRPIYVAWLKPAFVVVEWHRYKTIKDLVREIEASEAPPCQPQE
jgi:hypothetical protein